MSLQLFVFEPWTMSYMRSLTIDVRQKIQTNPIVVYVLEIAEMQTMTIHVILIVYDVDLVTCVRCVV